MMSQGMSRILRLLLLSVPAARLCPAATTAVWEINGYQDLLRGRMSGLSITADGRLMLGPKLDTFFSSDQPQIWSVAQAPDGSLYLGTGNRGRLIKVDAAGKGSVVWSADQPEIFAVAVDRAGVAYAGTSPDGKVYRIENGKATEYFAPGERYIWSLAFAPDGALFVATGQQGKIFRVTAAGRGDVYYETGQANVTCLAFDREGRLLAGSEPNGILYRITGSPAKGFVLYDSNLPEIRTIVPLPDGSIYAAALGGSVARRTGAASGAVQSTGGMLVAPPMSITVTDAQAGPSLSPKPEAPKPATAAPAVTTATSVTEVSGVEKSALYKILPDNTVETLWSSKEENIYDVVAEAGGTLLFFTDAQGRIYRMDPRPDRGHQATLVAQSNEGDAMRLIASQRGGVPGSVFAATGNAGKILRLDAGTGSSGWFESPVHDSGTVARWGRLTWVGDAKGIAFRTRAGNSARPDATWSDWSEPINDPEKSLITSPNARYIQWRAEFSAAASIDSVRVAYLPQNTPPTVRSITVSAQPSSAAKSAVGSTVYSVTVTDTADGSATAGSQSQTLSRPAGQQIQVSWQADDPDGDKLSYSLFFRGEDEHEWKLLRANISENSYLLDGDVLADGRYFFKVIASDRPSNPADQARQAELVGPPVLIDNTPPQVSAGAVRRTGSTAEIDVDAEDRASALRRCEYSVDAGPWLPVEAVDGVTDSPRERFLIHIDNFPAGEHLIVIRAYDSAGNAGLAKVVVR
jgi:outer membrane protein assembly factor BamB